MRKLPLWLLLFTLPLFAAVPRAWAEGRKALVMGNSAYAVKPLKNPGNDANAVASVLRSAGFEVQAGASTSTASP